MTEQTIDLIQPARVERFANGEWWHPALPDPVEGAEKEAFEAWLAAQRLECVWGAMADPDLAPPGAFEAYLEGRGWADWNPPRPEGDGWFLLCIADGEDGPAVWWARRGAL